MKNYLNISAFSFLFFLSCSKKNSVENMQPAFTVDAEPSGNGGAKFKITTGASFDDNKQYIGFHGDPKKENYGIEYRYSRRGNTSISCQII